MTPFDFSKYYKEMQARCQVRVDLSGIELKTSGNLPTDEGSNPLTEVVTNNVNYLIWKVTDASGTVINDPVRAYYNESIAPDGKLTGSFSSSGSGIEYCVRVFDNLGEIETLIGVAKSPFDTVDTPIDTVVFGDYTLHVIPRHTIMDPSGDPYTVMDNMNHVLGAFGFTRCRKTPTWYDNQGSTSNVKCIVGEDAMTRRITDLEKACRPVGTELYTRWYDTNFADPSNNENTDWDRIDHTSGSYGVSTSPSGTTISDLYSPNVVNAWITVLKSAGYMADMSSSGDGLNPFQLSIAEAFKTEYASADELQANFMTSVDDILNAVSDAPYIKAGTYVNALKKDMYSSTHYVTSSGSDSNSWLIDFDAMFGITPAFTYGTISYGPTYMMMPIAVSKYWGWYAVPTRDWYNDTAYDGVMWRRMVVRSYGDGSVTAMNTDAADMPTVTGRQIVADPVKDFDDLASRVHEACGKIFDPANVMYKAHVIRVWSAVYTIVNAQVNKSFSDDVNKGYVFIGASQAESFTNTLSEFESKMQTVLDALVKHNYSTNVFVAAWSNSIEDPPSTFTSTDFTDFFTSPGINEHPFPTEYLNNYVTSIVASSEPDASIDDSKVCYSPTFETSEPIRTLAFGASVHDAESAVSGIRKKAKAYNSKLVKMLAASALAGGVLSAAVIAIRMKAVDAVIDTAAGFESAVDAIKWYELYTGESVFLYRQFCGTYVPSQTRDALVVGKASFPMYKVYPARLLVPCSMYRKVKTRKRDLLGRKRTKWVKKNIGVRWVELRFVDTTVFSKYVQNPDDGVTPVTLNILGTMNSDSAGQGIVTLSSNLPESVSGHSDAEFSISGISGISSSDYYGCTIRSSTEIVVSDSDYAGPSGTFSCTVVAARVRPLPTQSSDSLSDVTVMYSMPHLPYDSEILDYAYKTYGPLDRSPYAIWDRDLVGAIVNDDGTYRNTGWSAFPSTSKEISAMRAGLDVYGKLAALLSFLRSAFGNDRVQLLCTSRSMDDQNSISCGGEDSAMLSWHNYGLAARIRILSSDGITTIKDGDSDYRRLVNMAEAFENAAYSGKLGRPVNTIWCGRLVVGADPFEWEFLPIGVSHKDAPLFREALLLQEDPVQAIGYVDAGSESDAVKYSNGVVTGGRVYVSPLEKPGYVVRRGIPLKDIREFICMIRLRMSAYGMTLDGRGDMAEWKVRNPESFAQLLVYYGMTGDVGTVRALLGGEYADAYQPLLSMYYESDPVTFVKRYLGNAYENAAVIVDGLGNGSYIRLSDGRLVMTMRSARSSIGMQPDNIFGQKQAGRGDMTIGQWKDGVFVSETDEPLPVYVTDDPVISGYSLGTASYGDAAYLHSVLASQIKTEFEGIKAAFDELSSPLMFDSLENGPNAQYSAMLENEFGLISAQDLIPYDTLRNTYVQNDINSRASSPDGTVLGAGANEEDREASAESIFEKMVSSAQLTGIRTAKLTKEHVTVSSDATGVTVEQFASIMKNGKIPSAKDIM